MNETRAHFGLDGSTRTSFPPLIWSDAWIIEKHWHVDLRPQELSNILQGRTQVGGCVKNLQRVSRTSFSLPRGETKFCLPDYTRPDHTFVVRSLAARDPFQYLASCKPSGLSSFQSVSLLRQGKPGICRCKYID